MKEHDDNLNKFLERCRRKGIQLNREKSKFRETSMVFMGHLITEDGLQTDPGKVRAITSLSAPANLNELRRFLGMVNYLARYLPHVTTVLQPLQNLLKKDVPWTWSEHHEKAFQDTKKMIAANVKLAYYDQEKELTLENDASEYGLGSVMMQEGKPVAFASRTLSPAERNYAKIEKEMLASGGTVRTTEFPPLYVWTPGQSNNGPQAIREHQEDTPGQSAKETAKYAHEH